MKELISKYLILSILIFFALCNMNCKKLKPDGKEFCEKNCKTACEIAGGDIGKCTSECIPSCENAGPNPFYDNK